jgi:23S rRNA (cytosine1962-C5)-methyltransferase
MLKKEDIITKSWSDYELLDSGNGRKLERFGNVVTDRPDSQAIWSPLQPKLWASAQAKFAVGGKDDKWNLSPDLLVNWEVKFNNLTFNLRFTSFKHVGLFPEHASQWEWIREKAATLKEPNVLNLFGYTGAATLAAAEAGAKVTHVDASKQSVEWASDNARATGLAEDRVRWIVDDAAAFVKREAKRGVKYEGIVLDPPAFGRGAKGQVWHIEEDLVPLLTSLKEILSDKSGSFVVLSGYAAGFAPESFAQAVESVFGKASGTFGSLNIQESDSDRVLPTGIYVRFTR